MMPFLRFQTQHWETNSENTIRVFSDKGREKGREEERVKQQIWADAFSHTKRMQDFQFICNTKGIQTETSTFPSVFTQAECQLQPIFAAPYNIKDWSNDQC